MILILIYNSIINTNNKKLLIKEHMFEENYGKSYFNFQPKGWGW